MRRTLALAAFAAVLSCGAASAQSRDGGLLIDVKPRSWLSAGSEVQVGQGRDYATSSAFGGAPVGGISSRGSENMPARGGQPLIKFDFLGANVLR